MFIGEDVLYFVMYVIERMVKLCLLDRVRCNYDVECLLEISINQNENKEIEVIQIKITSVS